MRPRQAAAREWILKQLGPKYLPETPNVLQGQEGRAGCARSDSPDGCARGLRNRSRATFEEQLKLYTLIWRRFVASQMTPAIYDVTTIEIAAVSDRTYDFRSRIGFEV